MDPIDKREAMNNFVLSRLLQRARRASSVKERDEMVSIFNALSIPDRYMHVDGDGLVHIVLVLRHRSSTAAIIMHSADVVWTFDPPTGTWNVLKDRKGNIAPLCPMRFGGLAAKETP